MSKPIVWTIAGSDSSGGAGIQTDLHTLHALGVHGCSVIAALTAQNSVAVSRIEFVSPDMITAQIESLESDLPARAIKMGMLGSLETLQTILPFLKRFSGALIYDPVLFATVGDALHEENIREFLLNHFIPIMTLLTPNIPEAEWLLGKSINTNEDIELAAQALLAMGPKGVLIKGGHAKFQNKYSQDYFASGKQKVWLTSKRLASTNNHGTGCSLASAVAACIALDYPLLDALVIAKAYISQGIRLSHQLGVGPGPITHGSWPMNHHDFPVITTGAHNQMTNNAFPACETLGFYPIVDSVEWVKRLLMNGVKTIQLRIKHCPADKLKTQLDECIKLAYEYKASLYINDHWELAIELGAYGVHLGQEDLDTADLDKLHNAGLRLGISAHCYSEAARALAFNPSYIAIGPVYATTTKTLRCPPLGLEQLQRYCKILSFPVVAIGGITLDHLSEVLQTGVNGVAVISAITKAHDPETEIQKWLSIFKSGKGINKLFSMDVS
jgi:hydroxymethylpyrimidine kinase / phosphomethylpyrimidine kinase / thiamine-phosphate diphosphorylase